MTEQTQQRLSDSNGQFGVRLGNHWGSAAAACDFTTTNVSGRCNKVP